MRLCFLRDERLSRYLDGELAVQDHREVQAHLKACPRCTRRLAELGAVDEGLLAWDGTQPYSAAPARLAVTLAVAASLLVSLAANLFLPQEAAGDRATLGVPEPPSDTLSSFYARISASDGER